ncbi:MAG: hypothetical protein CMF55_00440 [Legionellales bacterium]|nr:hypothetical protein [Legionellales bacterium]|tara:strand:+ start:2055 stop:2465 length:411 start_codon:yes stop_codon:yes gene_type:complete
MVQYSGNDPRHAVDIQETFASKGLLVKYDASGLLMTASVTDTPIGYTAAESSRGEDQALEAAGTGTASILPLDGLVYLKVANAISAPKFGLSIYTSQTASDNGTCDDDSSNSAVFIGYYCGDESAISAGDMIPVWC